ncbi:unnamed protein product [Peniophora sp. CBMAI 1063]|nr:unnamed protein product [Peniophora sp. CBMAI 1063]
MATTGKRKHRKLQPAAEKPAKKAKTAPSKLKFKVATAKSIGKGDAIIPKVVKPSGAARKGKGKRKAKGYLLDDEEDESLWNVSVMDESDGVKTHSSGEEDDSEEELQLTPKEHARVHELQAKIRQWMLKGKDKEPQCPEGSDASPTASSNLTPSWPQPINCVLKCRRLLTESSQPSGSETEPRASSGTGPQYTFPDPIVSPDAQSSGSSSAASEVQVAPAESAVIETPAAMTATATSARAPPPPGPAHAVPLADPAHDAPPAPAQAPPPPAPLPPAPVQAHPPPAPAPAPAQAPVLPLDLATLAPAPVQAPAPAPPAQAQAPLPPMVAPLPIEAAIQLPAPAPAAAPPLAQAPPDLVATFSDMTMDEVVTHLEGQEDHRTERMSIVRTITALRDVADRLCDDWTTLLKLWALHEQELEFPTADSRVHKLTVYSRPPEVKWWLFRGRKFASPPTISNVKKYGTIMREWYTVMMPTWHHSEETEWPLRRVMAARDSWENVKRGGANSLAIFIIALSWWFSQATKESEIADASSVCEDLVFVLSNMYAVQL